MTSLLPATDPAAEAHLRPHLQDGEELLWAARPDDVHFARLRPQLVTAGLFWTVVSGGGFVGFAVTLLDPEYDGISTGARIAILALCALPFALVGALALGGHVPVARRAGAQTAYGLTDRRVLLLGPRFVFAGPVVLRAFERDAVTTARTTPHATGSHTVEVLGGHAEEPLVLRACPSGDAIAARLQAPDRMRDSSSA